MTEFNFQKTMQEFVATSAIGVSALRNQGKGAHQAVRTALASMHLSPVKDMGQAEYRKWLDGATNWLLTQWPGTGRPWGAARKSVNLFMRDALYNQYLNAEHDIGHVENWPDAKVNEIDHRSGSEAVHQVPQRPAENQPKPECIVRVPQKALAEGDIPQNPQGNQ